MLGHVNVDFRTSPRLTEVQVRQLFDEMGDDPFHRLVESVECGGERGAPSRVSICVEDPVTADRALGMKVEASQFVREALAKRDIELTRLAVENRA